MNKTNPSLSDIVFLVGTWNIEISNAEFLPEPEHKASFSVEYKWIEDGAAIAVRQGGTEDDPQTASWIIGREESSEDYTVLYNDSRGISRVYNMSYKNNVWKMWRDNPEFMQRFEGKVNLDNKTIEAYWENSSDGDKNWHHDFDMLFSKA